MYIPDVIIIIIKIYTDIFINIILKVVQKVTNNYRVFFFFCILIIVGIRI